MNPGPIDSLSQPIEASAFPLYRVLVLDSDVGEAYKGKSPYDAMRAFDKEAVIALDTTSRVELWADDDLIRVHLGARGER